MTKSKEKILEDAAKKYGQTIMQGKKVSRDTLTKIEETAKAEDKFLII